MSGKNVTLSGPLFFPVLAPMNYSNGLPGQFPKTTLLVKPLLGFATGFGSITLEVGKKEASDALPVPIARRVALLVEPTMQLIAQVMSDPADGTCRFDGLSVNARFTAVSYDHLHLWCAVIADGLVPRVMP